AAATVGHLRGGTARIAAAEGAATGGGDEHASAALHVDAPAVGGAGLVVRAGSAAGGEAQARLEVAGGAAIGVPPALPSILAAAAAVEGDLARAAGIATGAAVLQGAEEVDADRDLHRSAGDGAARL